VYANLESALARLYSSVGLDVLPERMESHETADIARQLQARVDEWKKHNFTPRQQPEPIPVAIGEIIGVPAAAAAEFRLALNRILQLSRLHVVEPDQAMLRVSATVAVEPLRNGGRPATLRVLLIDTRTGAVKFTSQFRTTLSEPIDEEQWRTLGEGAAYRVAGPIARLQSGRPAAIRAPAAVPRAASEPPAFASPVLASPGFASPAFASPASASSGADRSSAPGQALLLRLDDKLRWPQDRTLQRPDLSRMESHGASSTH
jgi:hypothetical protein